MKFYNSGSKNLSERFSVCGLSNGVSVLGVSLLIHYQLTFSILINYLTSDLENNISLGAVPAPVSLLLVKFRLPGSVNHQTCYSDIFHPKYTKSRVLDARTFLKNLIFATNSMEVFFTLDRPPTKWGRSPIYFLLTRYLNI